MQRQLKLNLMAIILAVGLILMLPTALSATNALRLGCPIEKAVVNGDSIGIQVFVTNDVPLGALSLGFSYDSEDVEITSVQGGPALSTGGFGQLMFQQRHDENKVLVGWINFTPTMPIAAHSNEVHLMTLWVQVPLGTQSQCINIDSTFVDPGGFFIFSPQAGGSINPEYLDCGLPELSILGACATPPNTDPIVTDIPDQVLPFGSSFIAINLDDFVSDAENQDDEITWTASGNTDLTITIDANRTATIAKPSSDWSGSETVTFRATDPGLLFDEDVATFTIAAAAPVLVVSADSLFFDGYENGPDPVGQAIDITNGGNGSLDWLASETEDWISLTVTSGTAPSSTTVNVEIAALSIGRHTAEISVSATGAGNSPQSVVVVVDVIDDVQINLAPETLTFNAIFGNDPPSQNVAISNSSPSGIAFDWEALESAGWLSLNPGSGSSATDIEFIVDVTGLQVGEFSTEVIIRQLPISASSDVDTVLVELFVDSPTNVQDLGGTLPTSFSLSQNYPNPFNPSTTIQFDLPRPSNVSLNVFNILGQKVRELVVGTLSAGNKQIQWDGTDNNGRQVESGVYFYKISAGEFSQTRKMILLK